MRSRQTGAHPLEFGGGEVVGQLAANQMTTGGETIIKQGRQLYSDPNTGRQRRGSGGAAAGLPRSFIHVLRQLELNYDFCSMNTNTASKLLPYLTSLDPELRETVLEVAQEVAPWTFEWGETADTETIAALADKLEVNEIDFAAFQAATAPLYQSPTFVDVIGEDMIAATKTALGIE